MQNLTIWRGGFGWEKTDKVCGQGVNAQNRLRELCAAVVEESVSIMNYEGTPFELK